MVRFLRFEGLRACRKMEPARSSILLVDDDPDVRESLSLALEMHGYLIVPAENGQEALDKLKHTERLPLVVVLDLAMPILDGRGFLQQRAQDRVLTNIPVIIVSGSRPDETLSEVEAFLPKPVEITRLLESINRIEAGKEYKPA